MSISNWFIKNINRLTVFLGIRHQTDANKMPNSATATTNSQSDVVTNSGSQPVAYPTKPDDWQDAGMPGECHYTFKFFGVDTIYKY